MCEKIMNDAKGPFDGQTDDEDSLKWYKQAKKRWRKMGSKKESK